MAGSRAGVPRCAVGDGNHGAAVRSALSSGLSFVSPKFKVLRRQQERGSRVPAQAPLRGTAAVQAPGEDTFRHSRPASTGTHAPGPGTQDYTGSDGREVLRPAMESLRHSRCCRPVGKSLRCFRSPKSRTGLSRQRNVKETGGNSGENRRRLRFEFTPARIYTSSVSSSRTRSPIQNRS